MFERFQVAVFPGVCKETIQLREHRRAGELLILSDNGTRAVANAAKDTTEVLIDLLPLLLAHDRFFGVFHLCVKPRPDPFVLLPKGVHVDNEVSNDAEIRQRFQNHTIRMQVLQQDAAGEVQSAVDRHAAGTTDGAAARITERQRRILFVLDLEDRFKDGAVFRHGHLVGIKTRRPVCGRVVPEDVEVVAASRYALWAHTE